ncbi:MAG: hypothetical protein KDC70_13185 [Saprospiraceae bacterium]|nr:hypothetical protein [Saprospiraceae bacterium]
MINGFRVMALSGAEEMTSPNFGTTICDKEKPYYWGREWAKSGYNTQKMVGEFPALSAFRMDAEASHAFTGRTGTVSRIELAVVDMYQKGECESGKCKGCGGRTILEIFRDTETLLSYVFRFLGGTVHAVMDDGQEGLFNASVLDSLVSDAVISGYEPMAQYGDMLIGKNSVVSISNVEFPAAGLYGSAAIIKTPTLSCSTHVPVPIIPDAVIKSCCK